MDRWPRAGFRRLRGKIMSMTALSENDCLEILKDFQSRIPHVPNVLLTELAFNYGLDATADIDPMDVVSILAQPGCPEVFSVEINEQLSVEAGFSEIMSCLRNQGMSLSACAGCLLIVKANDIDLPAFGRIMTTLRQHLHPQAQWGHALYNSESGNAKVGMKLILAGTDSLNEVADRRQSVSSANIFTNEIPAFLRHDYGK